MKKLLVLMLVLGIASLANAAAINVLGDSSVGVGVTKTYTITISGSIPDNGLISFDVEVHGSNAKATMSSWTIISTGRNTLLDYVGDLISTPPDYGKEVVAAQDSGTTAIGSTLLSFDLTGVTTGTIDLTTEEIAFFTVTAGGGWNDLHPDMGSMQVTIVPEPMTLVLLGLGGLFLRRRR
jgi:hypothetical protein